MDEAGPLATGVACMLITSMNVVCSERLNGLHGLATIAVLNRGDGVVTIAVVGRGHPVAEGDRCAGQLFSALSGDPAADVCPGRWS